MRKQFLRYFLIILIILVACRKDEADEQPLPTAVATAIIPETLATPTTAPEATAVVPTPTAIPLEVTGVDPTAIDWPPQLIYSSPAVGEEVMLDGAITIRFDQPMDQASVEESFVVAASDTDEKATGTFTWPRPDTVIFTPRSELRRSQRYHVTVGATAVSANGQPLLQAIDLQVETVGFLEASQLVPSPDSSGVQTDSAITVLFNRPVVPLVSTGDQANLPQPLTIEPAIEGQGEWVSTSIYRFVPDRPLDGATTYTAAIAAGLTDITGGLLENDVSWSFTTLNPAVVSIEPVDASENIIPTDEIIVTFNMPMDTASTEAAMRLRGGSTATLTFDWSEDNRILTMRQPNGFDLDTTYTFTVGRLAQAINGAATVGVDTAVTFTTVPFPAVVGTTPRSGAIAEKWQYGINIRFASPMDVDTLEDSIQIDPAPATTPSIFFSEFSFELYMQFPLERNTDYIITIPANAADPYGNTLGRNYTFSFSTPGFDPIASFNLPTQVAQLSTDFPSDVGVLYVNTTEFDVALYELGLPLNLLSDSYNVYDYTPAAEPLRSWTIPVESSDNQADLYTLPLADGGSLPTGIYFLRLNAPSQDPNVQYWQNRRQLLIVADTNLVVKEMFESAHVWATDLATGEPVAGRNLTFYNDRGAPIGTAVTDANGFASLDYPAQEYLAGVTVISNEPGQDGFGVTSSRWTGNVNPWELGIETGFGAESEYTAYLYTDRPIYRPGDTIHYKGIVRENDYGRYTLPAAQTLQINLSGYNFFTEFGLEETFTAEVGNDGTFNGEYTIPEDAQLGTYQMFVSTTGVNGWLTFSVAEYRAPEFLVSVTPEQTEALRGDTVEVTVSAEYFFGGSASDLPVNWNVMTGEYRLPVTGPYYEFGDGGGFYYESFNPFGGSGFGGEYVTGGDGVTDGDGRFTITLPADLLDDFDPGSRTVTIEVSISDLSEFPVSGRTTVTFHAAETYVGVIPNDYISNAGTPATVNLLTTDWDGQAVANQEVEVIFYRRDWQATRTAEFGFYDTRWEPIDTEVGRAQTTTDGQGKATASFTPDEGGGYVAVATVTDANGRTNQSSTSLYVTDPFFGGWRTDTKERSMDLAADQPAYQVGDTARILVQSPFEGPINAWLTIERGDLLEQRVVTLQSQSDVLEIPITADFAPNVYISVAAIKPADNSASPYADMRLGIVELEVSPEQLEINVELTPRGTAFTPGDTVTYDIVTTDYAGNPVQADVSLALVDLAVLTLKADNSPPIAEAFYSRQPYRSQTGAGLFVSGEGVEPEVPVEALGLGGGGGGGEADQALARAVGDEEDDVRDDFPDTAFWAAKVDTGLNGRATVDIPLPDTLTTWRLSTKAVSADTLVGQTSVDIISTLPLLVRPVTPRFFTVGDVIQLGAIVNNNTDTAIEATVSLEGTGISLDGSAAQTINVPANGQQLVRWPVTVNDDLNADLTFRVSGGGFSDATKPRSGQGPDRLIPIYRYDAEDVVGTSGVLNEAGRRVEALLLPENVDTRRGTVDISLSPSLAAAMLETLAAQNDLDYVAACPHAVANHLLVNAVMSRAVHDLALDRQDLILVFNEQIPIAIDQLETLAFADGGWGWCYNDRPDPIVTAMVLHAIVQAQLAGFVVDGVTVANSSSFLTFTVNNAPTFTDSREVSEQAFYLLVLAELGIPVAEQADELVAEYRDLLSPSAQAMLALAYHFNEVESENQLSLLDDLNGFAILSATGAHWQEPDEFGQRLWGDVRTTAVVIEALSQVQPDNGLLPQAVRWLMAARPTLLWPSPTETAWSMGALTEWMLATGELNANFGYGLFVNGQARQDGTFTQDLILRNELVTIPTNQLLLDEVNFFEFRRGGGDGRLYYTMHLDSFIDANTVEAVSRGFTVQRTYYDAACDPETESCEPITQIEAGQQVRVELVVIAEHNMFNVIINDPTPSGAEAIDPNLETSATGFESGITRTDEQYQRGYWGWWYFDRIEFRDEQVRFFSSFLPAGSYQYTYYLQTVIPGEFQVMPTTAREEFFVEVYGRSDGLVFTIAE